MHTRILSCLPIEINFYIHQFDGDDRIGDILWHCFKEVPKIMSTSFACLCCTYVSPYHLAHKQEPILGDHTSYTVINPVHCSCVTLFDRNIINLCTEIMGKNHVQNFFWHFVLNLTVERICCTTERTSGQEMQ